MTPALTLPHTNGISTNGATPSTNGAIPSTNGKTHTTPTQPGYVGFGTRAIHVGSAPDPSTGAVIPPISLSTTYRQSAIGVHQGFEYSRSGNPNRNALESTLAALEAGGSHAIAFSSGSATTATVLQSLGPNAHIISVNDVYGGTFRYMTKVAGENQGLQVDFVDLEDLEVDEEKESVFKGVIRENTKLIWIESPTNPTLRLIDIPRIVSLARSAHPTARPLVLVDNTFLSPFYSSPLLLGADIVLHSLTKYINGHSDVVMGALILPEKHEALTGKLRFLQNAIGAVPSAFDCWLAQRGAKTLHLRMKAHGENALAVAKVLAEEVERKESVVKSVAYPGVKGRTEYERRKYELAWRMMSPQARRWVMSRPEWYPQSLSEKTKTELLNPDAPYDASAIPPLPPNGFPFSGMISLTLTPPSSSSSSSSSSQTPSPSLSPNQPSPLTLASTLLTSLHLFSLAESLGGVESLAEHPAQMTHGSIPTEEREKLGISDGMVRLSVGVEDKEEVVADVRRALGILEGMCV